MPVSFILFILLLPAGRYTIVLTSTPLRLISPIRSNMPIMLKTFKTGIHSSFLQLILLIRQLMNHFRNFVTIPVSPGQKIQNDCVRMSTKQIRCKFFIYHAYTVYQSTMTVKVVIDKFTKDG